MKPSLFIADTELRFNTPFLAKQVKDILDQEPLLEVVVG